MYNGGTNMMNSNAETFLIQNEFIKKEDFYFNVNFNISKKELNVEEFVSPKEIFLDTEEDLLHNDDFALCKKEDKIIYIPTDEEGMPIMSEIVNIPLSIITKVIVSEHDIINAHLIITFYHYDKKLFVARIKDELLPNKKYLKKAKEFIMLFPNQGVEQFNDETIKKVKKLAGLEKLWACLLAVPVFALILLNFAITGDYESVLIVFIISSILIFITLLLTFIIPAIIEKLSNRDN